MIYIPFAGVGAEGMHNDGNLTWRSTAAYASPPPPPPSLPCFTADVTADGKFQCPECKQKEGGTLRIITHNYGCPNKGREYCQRTTGGKRRNKKTKKRTRRHRRTRRN